MKTQKNSQTNYTPCDCDEILSNKNNPLVEVRFRDVYPTSLSGLDYSQNAADVDYLTADVTFDYTLYEIVTI